MSRELVFRRDGQQADVEREGYRPISRFARHSDRSRPDRIYSFEPSRVVDLSRSGLWREDRTLGGQLLLLEESPLEHATHRGNS